VRKSTIATGQGSSDVVIWRQFGQVAKCCNGRRRPQHSPSDALNIGPSYLACAFHTQLNVTAGKYCKNL